MGDGLALLVRVPLSTDQTGEQGILQAGFYPPALTAHIGGGRSRRHS
jgi:hypothetical protein